MAPRGASSLAVPPRVERLLGRLQQSLAQNPRFRLARRLYRRHAYAAPAVFFFGGVGWDAATLGRIDAWFDNLFLLGYLGLLGALVVGSILDRHGRLRHPRLQALRPWFPPAVQFLTGALFSAYVIYYAQSATWTNALFLLVLAGLLVANEFIWRRAFNLYALLGIYFLATLSFFIFFLPVLLGMMGYGVFLLSGLVSLVVVGGLLYVLHRRGVLQGARLAATGGLLVGLFAVVHLFYVQNWIPPVPLALRAGGAYHDVQVDDGAYVLAYEPAPWYRPWRRADDVIHPAPGDTVYCFAAVFAPTALETQIVHHWQRFDARSETWQTTDRIPYAVTGGRARGYRGYTYKRHAPPGRWRVNVETPRGQTIGRIHFEVAPPDSMHRPRLARMRYE